MNRIQTVVMLLLAMTVPSLAAQEAAAAPATVPGATCGWVIRTHATNVSSVSGGEALAFDSVTNTLFVKSLLDPSGTNLQFAQVSSNGTVTLGPTYPALRSSDFSGIVVDPTSGDIITADEIGGAGGRIVRVNVPAASVSTLFDVPWVMNVASNGTGQQQYAIDPSAPDRLYFWDSTLSKLFRLNRSTSVLAQLFALDQGTPAGQHISTFTNDVAVDPTSGMLLLSDGSSNSILQLDAGTSPATVTTLFSGLTARPAALTLHPSTNSVFVILGFNSVWAGPRSGGSLSPIATGFSFLADIVAGSAAAGTMFAVDKSRNEVYAITSVAQALENLLGDVNSADIPAGIQNSLASKLDAALADLDRGQKNAGANVLDAFQNAVSAQSGKKIDPAIAAAWIAAAQAIIDGVAACG